MVLEYIIMVVEVLMGTRKVMDESKICKSKRIPPVFVSATLAFGALGFSVFSNTEVRYSNVYFRIQLCWGRMMVNSFSLRPSLSNVHAGFGSEKQSNE